LRRGHDAGGSEECVRRCASPARRRRRPRQRHCLPVRSPPGRAGPCAYRVGL